MGDGVGLGGGVEGGWVGGYLGRGCGVERGFGTECGEKGVGYGVILGNGVAEKGVVEGGGGRRWLGMG